MPILDNIRNRYHPLHLLRTSPKWRWIQKWVDFDIAISMPILNSKGKMYVRALRDAAWILPHSGNESFSRSVFRKLILKQETDIFLDVGANVGIYSWEFINLRTQGQAVLFEVDDVNLRLLHKSVSYNKYRQVFVVPQAVSDKVEVSTFYMDEVSGATGSLTSHLSVKESLHAAYNINKTKYVVTTQLDNFKLLARNKKSFIKIDVEGAEDRVLRGAMDFISANKPILQIETNNLKPVKSLADLGYTAFEMGENSNILFCPQDFVNAYSVFIDDLGLKTILLR